VTSVVFPDKNEADIRDIPEDIQKDLKILKINELEEIIDVVLN
jgi:ATP-dependent Lon protease